MVILKSEAYLTKVFKKGDRVYFDHCGSYPFWHWIIAVLRIKEQVLILLLHLFYVPRMTAIPGFLDCIISNLFFKNTAALKATCGVFDHQWCY